MKNFLCIMLLFVFLFSFVSCSLVPTNLSSIKYSTLDDDEKNTSTSNVDQSNLQQLFFTPVHFEGVDENTRKDDIHNIYGTPTKVFEEARSEAYNLTFLNISGLVEVTYMNNSDKVFMIRFTVNSRDFESIASYEQAVAATIAHFEERLSHLEKVSFEENGKTIYQWHNENKGYVYSVYYTQSINKDENGNPNWNDLSDATVFQFNHYSIIDSE